MSSRSRNREPPSAEDSWRFVEGEHDSFDTSILPSFASDEDGPLAAGYPSSGQPSSALPSQLSFGDQASQDSIRDFARHRDDDNVILRAPFRPTIPLPASRFKNTASSAASARHDGVRHRVRYPNDEMHEAGTRDEEMPPPRREPRAAARSPLRLVLTGIMSLAGTYCLGGLLVMLYNFTTYPLALSTLPLPVRFQHHHSPCLDLNYIGGARRFSAEAHERERLFTSLEIYVELSRSCLTQLRPLVEADSGLTHKSLVLGTFDSYFNGTANITLAIKDVRDSIFTIMDVTVRQADVTASQLRPTLEAPDASPSRLHRISSWLFSPFTVPQEPVREYQLHQRHLQHLSILSRLLSEMHEKLQRLATHLRVAKEQVDTIIQLGPPPIDNDLSVSQAQPGWGPWTLLAVKRAQPVLVYNGLQDLSALADAFVRYRVDLGRLLSHALFFQRNLAFEDEQARLDDKGKLRWDHCSPREAQVKLLHQVAAELRDYMVNPELE
jgi:hypothetical protein